MRLDPAVARLPPMHIQIGNHAADDELLPHKILRQPDRLGLAQLARQGDLDLAGQHGVFAQLAGIHLVPERLAITPALRRVFGQQDFGMDHAGLGQEVLGEALFLVIQRLARPVGRGRDHAAALRALDHFRLQMVDGHRRSGTVRRTP